MIHSIVPISCILKDIDKEKIRPYEELMVKGVSCYVEKVNDFEYKIIRIHTTNPNHYLNSSLQPGSIINLKDSL